MVKIKIDGSQCDFCSIQDIDLFICENCGKDICQNHADLIELKIEGHRKSKLKKSMEYYLCPDCAPLDEITAGAASTIFNDLAIAIIEEKNKPPEEPDPPEVLP